MSAAKQLGKSQADRLAKIEEQLLYMSEVSDGMRLLKFCLNEITAKADMTDEMASRLETMSICELMNRVKILEDKATSAGGFECRDSSTGLLPE